MTDIYKHSFKDTLKENLGMAVYNTGNQKCEEGTSWGPALRDHYLIHFVLSGRGVLETGGNRYMLKQGDLFVIFPSRVAAYTADCDDPWEYCWVGFNGTEAKRMVTLAGFTEDEPAIRPGDGRRIQSCLQHIYDARGATPAAAAKMAGYLYLFFGSLMEESNRQTQECSRQDYLAKALRFIQYNYAGDIGVQEMAEYVGISRSQLYRAFIAQFGLSPHNFLQRYRINEACCLLRSRGVTVAQVAGSVGFTDPLYFSKVFHKVKHCTPTAYQKQVYMNGQMPVQKAQNQR